VPPSGVVSPFPGSGLGTPAEPIAALSKDTLSPTNGHSKQNSLDGESEKSKPGRKPENPLSRD
jgi:hypothetical protein